LKDIRETRPLLIINSRSVGGINRVRGTGPAGSRGFLIRAIPSIRLERMAVGSAKFKGSSDPAPMHV